MTKTICTLMLLKKIMNDISCFANTSMSMWSNNQVVIYIATNHV